MKQGTVWLTWRRWDSYVSDPALPGWIRPTGRALAPYHAPGDDDLPAYLAKVNRTGHEAGVEDLSRLKLVEFYRHFGLLGQSVLEGRPKEIRESSPPQSLDEARRRVVEDRIEDLRRREEQDDRPAWPKRSGLIVVERPIAGLPGQQQASLMPPQFGNSSTRISWVGP